MTDHNPNRESVASAAKNFANTGARAATDAASDIAHAASETAGKMKDKAADIYDSAKQTTETLAGKMKSSVADFASDATHVLRDTIEEQKSAGAGAIADLAKSARETAEGFESQSPQIAGAVKSVASKIEAVSNDIKDKTVGDMVDAMAGFAQKQPLAFLGCGVVAGLVLARLLSPASRA